MNSDSTKDKILDDFHEYLSSILELYKKVVPVLKEELDAIINDNIEVLNASLKSQQALLLKTKTFDNQVDFFLNSLGIKAKNITEMVHLLPDSHRMRFYDLVGAFDLTITEVSFYKEKCRMLLQSKLYTIDKALEKYDFQKDITTYNKNASEVHGSVLPKAFEKKI